MKHKIQNQMQWAYISILNTDLIPDTIQKVLSLENWEARNNLYFCEVSRHMSDLCKGWKFFYWVKLCVDFEKSAPQEKWYFEHKSIKIQSRKPKTVHVETLSEILNVVQLTSSISLRELNSHSAQAVQAPQKPENDNSDKKNQNSLQNITENYFETAINQSVCSKRSVPAATGHKP
ncbi:conserved hypothetical protein [Coccidioides posadasii str. Silveira]|uniref:Uncharacterized protein n=1 Tax=Coccidioides posadasii (strain RMSCC 757 / Silveira) TaxID=443226 RepID=E9DAM2_COCPS|nr:conserved hypothetical protein [Coccidioides posadasii str. Silveira]